MRQLVHYQQDISFRNGRLVAISADEPPVMAAYRAGLGATFTFLSDHKRQAINRLGIRDETEEEYSACALPTTFVLMPNLSVYKIYDGWFYVGRPTVEALLADLRIVQTQSLNA